MERSNTLAHSQAVPLTVSQALAAIARNQAHRLIGGAVRGGHRTARWDPGVRRAHGESIFAVLAPQLGDLRHAVGLEIGPGDNLEVCSQCLKAGAERMYAVEMYAQPLEHVAGVTVLRQRIEDCRLPERADFAYSNDVFEHVVDVRAAMKRAFDNLKPGALFVNCIDLRGHNVFNRPERPLDFLSCPDWLWKLMHSHVVTTNRVRASDFMWLAKQAGFEIVRAEAIATADRNYLASIRPHLLERYRDLADDDLGTLEMLLVLRRPARSPDCVASQVAGEPPIVVTARKREPHLEMTH